MKSKRLSAFTAMIMLTAVLAGCNNNEQSTGIFSGNSSAAESPASSASSTSQTVSSEVSSSSEKEISSASSTESSTAESSESSSESTLPTTGGDVFCFEFSVDDETYKFPLKYSEMEKNGWSYKSNYGEKEIKSNQYLIGPRIEKGDLSMTVQPINFTDSTITANEANIGKLVLDIDYIKPESHTASYAGIVLGKSVMNDVLTAFGEPSSTYESDNYPTVTYKMKTTVTVKFSFDNTKGGIVSEIDIQNFSND